MPEALENGLTMVRERASRHGVMLHLAIDPAVNIIEADERKVKQGIFNLLSNVVKFTQDGGQVSVVARSAPIEWSKYTAQTRRDTNRLLDQTKTFHDAH